MPRALVVQNTPTSRPRRLGEWLEADGINLDVARPFDSIPLPHNLEHDAVIVLGGGYMPTDDERAPWLPQTRKLAQEAIDSGTPTLGICLGGQLLAHVAGGAVKAESGRTEIGSTAIRLNNAATEDQLFGGLPTDVTGIEHHVDSIEDLPANAVLLASSEQCPVQAFRVGDSAWGVQFHPEISADDVTRWSPDSLIKRGLNPFAVVSAAKADEATAIPVWRELARRFATVVAGRAG